MSALLKRHKLDIESAGLKLSPMLSIDAKTQRFIGENAENANKLYDANIVKVMKSPRFRHSLAL